jgi:hypothetical protein
MARSWTGVRRPTEEVAIRRLEKRRSEPPVEWWQKWNELDGGRWAREKTDEEARMQRLLRAMMQDDDDEAEKARRLARALGLLNGGDR